MKNFVPAMKTLTKLMFAASAIAVVVSSCRKDNLNELSTPQDERIQVNNNQSELQQRVHFRREVLNNDALKSFNPIDLELVAEVDAPVVNGVGLAATHIQFEGNLAYVTYHTFDSPYGGAIDVFDVSNPDNPVLVSQLSIADTDFHNLDINSNKLYVAGARDLESSGYDPALTKGAIAQKIDLDGNGYPTNAVIEVPLPSYSANSIRYNPAGILVSSGDVGGGSFILDKNTMSTLDNVGVNDAKYIHGTSSYLAILAGEGATSKLIIYNGSSFNAANKIEIPLGNVDVTTVGKNAIECYEDFVLVNLGDDGLMQINRYNGSVIGTYKFEDGDGIAISAVNFNQYTILAYGCDGVLILDKDKGKYRKIGEYKFSDNGSVNHVSTNGSVIFVASGLQGIRILRNVQKNCTLEHITEGSTDRSFWFEAYYPSTFTPQVFKWETGTGDFVQHPDGTAEITGTIVSTKNANDKWVVTINLKDKMNWTQWSGLGRSYQQGPGYVPGSHEDWFYYIMDASNPSTLVGLGANAGTTKVIDHKPTGYKYGFQLGDGANVKNGSYGLSGWFSYLNSAGDRRTGDINVNVTGC